MKKLHLSILFCLLMAGPSLRAQSSSVIRNYIETYKEIAIEEMRRTGVPASITLAQGIHETGAGQSVLVQKSNNHFGIKCKSDWKGESVSHDDDARGECFRKYENPFDSYRDHSDFLKNRAHYASLFRLDPTDYKAWAHGLKKAGYATNPKYPQILIKLIESYNLQDYTLIALNEKKPSEEVIWASNVTGEVKDAVPAEELRENAPRPEYPSGIFRINGTPVVFVARGTSFLALAQQHKVDLPRLFEFNERQASEVAEEDQLVFLQRKRKTGEKEFHIVAQGESLYAIAQAEGVRMDQVLALNFLRNGMEVAPGEKIYLQKEAPAMPRLKGQESSHATADTEPDYHVHIVQPKETLYSITKKYDVSQEDVLKWNNLPSADLKTGQQLRINKR